MGPKVYPFPDTRIDPDTPKGLMSHEIHTAPSTGELLIDWDMNWHSTGESLDGWRKRTGKGTQQHATGD